MNIQATDGKIIVRIYASDKQTKTTSEGGIITTNVLNPTLDYCQIGEAVSVGDDIKYIKKGETVLFAWFVEDSEETLLDMEGEDEFRYVTERQIFGTVKQNKQTGYSHIQPKKEYVLAEPREKDFALTRSIFQIPVSAINPLDKEIRGMGIKPQDWIIVLPNSAVPISVKRRIFWFIHYSDILCINKGQHKISIMRKHVSDSLRLSSRKVKTMLN